MSAASRGRLTMGTWNYLWHLTLAAFLCARTVMALEGTNATTATPESHVDVLRSTNRTGPAASSSNASVAEPTTQAAPALLGKTLLSPTTTRTEGGDGRMDTTPTTPAQEGSSQGLPARSKSVSPALSTAAGPGTTAPSTGTENGTASSVPHNSSVTSHSSSSSSSSPKGSPAVTPSPQQSSTSSTTGTPLGTTSHPTALVFSSPSSPAGVTGSVTAEPIRNSPAPSTSPVPSTSGSPSAGSSAVTPSPQQSNTSSTTGTPLGTTSQPTALVFSSPSSPAGTTGAQLTAVTAEAMTQGPATPRPVASTSSTSPTPGTIEDRLSSTLGRNTETSTAQLTSTPLTQEQATVEAMATSPPMGSPLPSVSTASVGSSATTPPGEGESSTMEQGSGMITDPSVQTSHSLPATSPASPTTTRMVSGEGRTDTTPTTTTWEGSGAVNPTSPTAGPGTTAPSMGTENGTASSVSLSSAVTSHSSSSSSSSSPKGSPAVTPSPQQSSTSSTSGTPLGTTSQPTALVFSSVGVTGMESGAVTPSPALSTASTNPVASAPITSPAPRISESSHSPTLSSSTGTLAPRHTSTPLTQGQTTVEVTATSPPTGNPLSSTITASAGSSATTPPEEGESSTTEQGSGMITDPSVQTSHSLPSTTLATPSATNRSISTSVNPSFNGTCLPVSITVQNVTAEEIQLNWTSSSKGSLYNISVRDAKLEINKTTTEKTGAVFKHLLPGHVYTISVAVSSCAENNQTSVTVRTDPSSCFKRTEFCSAENTGCSDLKGIVCFKNQALACTVLLKNQTFNDTLYNSDSPGYQEMAARIKTDVVGGMRAELNSDRFGILVLGFRPGSVVVDFLSLLPKEEPVDVDFIQGSLNKVLRSKFGDHTKVTVQPLSVQSSNDNSSSWRVAVIVLGVLLGVSLVLIFLAILFYIYVRRRSGIYFE